MNYHLILSDIGDFVGEITNGMGRPIGYSVYKDKFGSRKMDILYKNENGKHTVFMRELNDEDCTRYEIVDFYQR